MKFLFPEFIYMMLIPAAILIYLISTNKDVVERVFDEKTLERLRISGDALGRSGHNTLTFLAFFFMTLALAQPVIEQGEERVKSHGIDLVIAIDLSRSMKATDFYPDRLQFSKQKLREILPSLPAGRIGLIGFTSASFIIAPLTTDRDTLRFLLDRVSSNTVTAEGTDLSSALKGAEKLLEKSSNKAVLLVTDGGEEKDVDSLIEMAKKTGIRVIVWMVASPQGAPIPLDDRGTLQKRAGEIVVSRANRKLRRLAKETGGIYVAATLTQRDEKEIAEFLNDLSNASKTYEKVIEKRIELFYYPLALALLIFPFALYSIGRRKGQVFGFLAWASVLTLSPDIEAGVFDFMLIDKGQKAYHKGDYKESTKAFETLAAHSPKSEVWFDLGNSYYRSGRYKMACDAFAKVVTSDIRIEKAKLYNMANCYVKLGKLEKAAELYRKVLTFGKDEDARYNLDLVMKALREKKKSAEGAKGDKIKEKMKKNRESSAASASEEGSKMPGMNKNRAKTRKLSRAEEKKWMRLIEKQPLKSKLYPLTQPQEGSDVDPW